MFPFDRKTSKKLQKNQKRTLGRKELKLKGSSHPEKLTGHLNVHSNDSVKNKLNLPIDIIANDVFSVEITM